VIAHWEFRGVGLMTRLEPPAYEHGERDYF
jgi:hypothetical protein